MNIKTNITHQSSQTITQITKRYFSYQLFVIGAVMTKACGGSSGDGGASAILINGSAPIATAGIMDVTGADLIDTSGDDTYLIDYGQGSGTIELQVNPFDGEVGASGYDTVLVQGYSGAGFNPLVTVGFILIKTAGYPDIEFAFPNSDIFERFVFDVGDVDGNVDVDGNGDGLINGSDFVWLIGYKNENYEIEGTDVKDYIRGGEGDDTINGFAGDDEIYGRAGDDTINGGDGDDIINGGLGDDTIDGGDGDDTIFYNKGGGNDVIEVGDGNDVLILLGFVEDDIISQRMDDDLKLNFKSTSGGGSIILKNSINDDEQGIDRILFDTNGNGIEDNQEIVWEDEDFEGYLPRLIDGGLPIDTVGRIDMIEEYNSQNPAGTRLILTDTLGDDTYIVDFDKVTSSGVIEFGVDGVAGGFDTVIVQGYPENSFKEITFSSGDVISIPFPGGSKPDIKITFQNFDFFERFIFDTNNNNRIDGNDFTWLLGSPNVNYEIKGTNVKDYIHVWEGNDIIYGYAGNDILNGGQGDDIIYGNDDDDIIYGGTGDDEIYGDAGDDTIYGGTGIDYIYGGLGIDTIEGNEGNDFIYGGAGADTIDGGAGNDYIYGQGGDDTIDGGAGNNKIFYYKGDGNDVLSGDDGVDTLILVGFDLDDVLSIEQTGGDLKLNFKPTSGGGSIILKNSVNDDARGIDKIVLDTNADEIEDSTDIIWEDNDFERDIVNSNIFYTIYGDNGDDEIYGNDEDNIIDGGDGDDTIDGGAGNDILSGEAGNDYIYGNDGIDTINGGDGNDLLSGEAGNDILYGGAGIDTIYGGAGADTIYGEAGNDILYGGAGIDTIVYNKGDGDDTIYGGIGDDVLILRGFVEDDILNLVRTGDDLNDLKLNFKPTLQGEDGGSIILKNSINDDDKGIDKIVFDTNADGIQNAGDIIWEDHEFEGYLQDFIHGGSPIATVGRIDVLATGSVVLTNTPGDDTYLIDYTQVSGALQVNGVGGGYDTVLIQGYTETGFTPKFIGGNVIRIEPAGYPYIQFTFANDDIFERFVFDVDGDGLINNSDFVWLVGNRNANYDIEGTDVKFYIYGGGGDDTIYGDDGNDNIYGDDGNDIIYGGAGIDILNGDDGDDTIYGGDGNDEIYGGGGNNKIVYNKGDGDDTIEVGDGDDALILVGFDLEDILSLELTDGDLKLNFNDNAQGGSIILKDTINDDAIGINKIVFDTNSNGQDSTDITWLDDGFFVNYIAALNIPYTYTINGGAGNDILYASILDDTIYGNAGNDIIRGGAGDDILYGGAGNDSIYGGGGDDTIHGGDGDDIIRYKKGEDNKGEGHDIIDGGAGVDVLILRWFGVEDILNLVQTGADLKLNFKESVGGGSIILKNSFNNDERGIDKIVFDANLNGEDVTDTTWEDDASFTNFIDGA